MRVFDVERPRGGGTLGEATRSCLSCRNLDHLLLPLCSPHMAYSGGSSCGLHRDRRGK
jgi:hypothetical protein